MTHKEIKNGMTQGEWTHRAIHESPLQTLHDEDVMTHNSINIEAGEYGKLIGDVKFIHIENGKRQLFVDIEEESISNAYAICNSVNNTYGHNIDPTIVPELLAFVENVSRMNPYGNPYPHIIIASRLLLKAKITI